MKQYPTYSNYKDSGVDWLGEIPEGWEVKRSKYLFRERNQRSEKGNETLLSVSQYTGVTKKSDKLGHGDLLTNASTLEGYKVVHEGDLVSNIMLAWNGSLGFSSFSGITSPAYSIYFLIDSNTTERFLHYLFRTDKYKSEFKRNSSGVIESRLRLYTEDFFNILVLLPPLNQQTAIANFLDEKTAKIDEAVRLKEQLILRLKERKQILIQNAVTKGLNSNAPMKDSGIEWIGKIPEHWEIATNQRLFTETKDAGKQGLPILSVSIHSGVSKEELGDDENLRGQVRIEDKTSYKYVKNGDIAYNMMRAWQGGIGYVQTEGMVSPAYVTASPKEMIDSQFFEYQYRSPLFIEEMNRASKGITDFRKRLYWEEFKKLVVVLPPLSEQAQIVARIETASIKIDLAITQAQSQIEKLKEYKTILIDSAVTGKIKIY